MDRDNHSSFHTLQYVRIQHAFLNELIKGSENLFIRKPCIYQEDFISDFNEIYIRLRSVLLEKKENCT